MQPAVLSIPCRHLDRPSSDDLQVLLAHARMLQRPGDPRLKRLLLKGKNLGLLCESAEDADAALFRDAAAELGARVSHIRPGLSALGTPDVRRDTSQMLGRLYDGIECQGLPALLVEEIGREAGIPVYDGIAGRKHPTVSLIRQLDGDASEACKRQLLLQAVLLATLR